MSSPLTDLADEAIYQVGLRLSIRRESPNHQASNSIFNVSLEPFVSGIELA